MPLSEHEQRLLDQIERGLYAEDPKFAHAVQATDPRAHYKRRMLKAALGFVAGVCLLMAGVILKLIPISVVGFVVMLACCVWGLSSWKRVSGGGTEQATQQADPKAPKSPRPPRPSRSRQSRFHPSRGNKGSFMERMEERWRRRREDGR